MFRLSKLVPNECILEPLLAGCHLKPCKSVDQFKESEDQYSAGEEMERAYPKPCSLSINISVRSLSN